MNYIGRNPRPNYNNKYRVKRRFTRKRAFRRTFGKKWPARRYGEISRTVGHGSMKTLDVKFAGTPANPYGVDSNTPTNLPINVTGCMQFVNCIQLGNGVSQRIGNKIKMKSLRIRFEIDSVTAAGVNTTTYANESYLRFIVMYDRETNNYAPTTGAGQTVTAYWPTNVVLQDIRQDNNIINGNYDSNLSIAYQDRFVILRDKLIVLPPWVAAGNDGAYVAGVAQTRNYIIDDFITLKSLETVFSGSSAPMSLSYCTTGALHIMVVGDVAAGSEAWSLTGITRLRFQDC
nr:MAG: capsid protein [Cressdnaviricota sp.]